MEVAVGSEGFCSFIHDFTVITNVIIILFALDKYSGGNPVHPREIPVWQKEITCFFQVKNDEQSQPSANDEDEDEDIVELRPQETMQTGSSEI